MKVVQQKAGEEDGPPNPVDGVSRPTFFRRKQVRTTLLRSGAARIVIFGIGTVTSFGDGHLKPTVKSSTIQDGKPFRSYSHESRVAIPGLSLSLIEATVPFATLNF